VLTARHTATTLTSLHKTVTSLCGRWNLANTTAVHSRFIKIIIVIIIIITIIIVVIIFVVVVVIIIIIIIIIIYFF